MTLPLRQGFRGTKLWFVEALVVRIEKISLKANECQRTEDYLGVEYQQASNATFKFLCFGAVHFLKWQCLVLQFWRNQCSFFFPFFLLIFIVECSCSHVSHWGLSGIRFVIVVVKWAYSSHSSRRVVQLCTAFYMCNTTTTFDVELRETCECGELWN